MAKSVKFDLIRFTLSIFLTSVQPVWAAPGVGICAKVHNPTRTTHGNPEVFKLKHSEFIEDSGDGLIYVHPQNDSWQFNTSFKSKVSAAYEAQSDITFSTPRLDLGQTHFLRTNQKTNGVSTDLLQLAHSGNFLAYQKTGVLESIAGAATGIRLRLSSSNPDVVVTLHVHSPIHNSIRLVRLKLPKEPTAFYIPWSAFETAKTRPYEAFPRDWTYFPDMGFMIEPQFQSAELMKKPLSQFNFTVHGPIVYERDIMNSPGLFKMITDANYDVIKSYDTTRNLKFKYRNEKWSPEENRQLMAKALLNLHNPELQAKALQIGRKGRRAVDAAIAERGFHPVEFSQKVERPDFFRAPGLSYLIPLQGQTESSYTKTGIHTPGIPYEMGAFAKEHGVFSHALQILTMTEGMTPRELNVFHRIYGSIFGDNSASWVIWDIVFDAPGNSLPNSPLWWRDRLADQSAGR